MRPAAILASCRLSWRRNMTSLGRDASAAWQSVAASGRFKRLVVVRDERLPISPGGAENNSRAVGRITAGGAYAAASARGGLRRDRSRSTASRRGCGGDLSVNGQTVAPNNLKTWLAGNLNAPATEFLDALDATESAGSREVVERVQESARRALGSPRGGHRSEHGSGRSRVSAA